MSQGEKRRRKITSRTLRKKMREGEAITQMAVYDYRTAVDPRGDFGDVRIAPLPFYDPGKRKPRRGWPVAGTRRR